MAGDVVIVYLDEQPPESWSASVFLGGPQGPSFSAAAWRSTVIALFRERWSVEGKLVVFVPEPSSRTPGRGGTDLADWYDRAFRVGDVVLFWWPDQIDPSLVPGSLVAWNDRHRVVHGAPEHLAHGRYLLEYADSHGTTAATTLPGLVDAALDKIGPGARRVGGEREVPLPVWRTGSFQHWYSAQTSAGNVLLGARQIWTFSTGRRSPRLLYWALHVRIYVASEDRTKANEIVISRPDISVLALYRRGASIDDTTVVLVREFRSPASTSDGMVHELPGGSGPAASAREQAASESEEETGLAIDVRRIRAHSSRQLAATVSAHHAHLFTAEITRDELARLRASSSTPYGAGDSERTWPEITTFGELRRNRLVDWATFGMIAAAILDLDGWSSE